MKFFSVLSSVRRLTVLATLSVISAGFAADAGLPAASEPFDYAAPRQFTGTLYEIGSNRTKVLFTFRRTATRSGSTVHVERQFVTPAGSVAAVETVVYESGRLVSFQMREFQANVSGAVEIAPDPQKPAQPKLFISYDHGLEPPKGTGQNLPPDTVTDDSLYPFMLAHWDDLMRGDAVKFRFVAMEWKQTFGFRFVKTADTTRNGRPVAQIKMEPTNLILAGLVNPLYFTVEKAGAHRVLSYIGRTTPRIKKGKAWKYLDAETVFDWK